MRERKTPPAYISGFLQLVELPVNEVESIFQQLLLFGKSFFARHGAFAVGRYVSSEPTATSAASSPTQTQA
jgi:hypothetical protein